MRDGVRRRRFLQGTAGTLAAAAMVPPARWPRTAQARTAQARTARARTARARSARARTAQEKFRELDGRIIAGMKQYGVPGTAVAVLYQGQVHLRGFGVTNSRYPVPVTPGTLFQVGSITKTCTGVTLLRLADQGRVDLAAEVRRYLPGVPLPAGAETVTVRDLVTHAAGWLPQVFTDYGRGPDALPRYVAGIHQLPVLTPPGTLYNYGASHFALAGYLVQQLTGSTYEYAVRDLLLRPLGLRRSFFFADEIFGYNVCAPHVLAGGRPVPDPGTWYLPRSVTAAGATLVSSVTDMLRYTRFELGDGRAPDGTRLLSARAMQELRRPAGPGSTDLVELLGASAAGWHVRPTAQGVHIVGTGGDTNAMKSAILTVPAQDFAMILLANSASAGPLILDLFVKDWALQMFTGLTNLPTPERRLSPAKLAPYEGRYVQRSIPQGAGTTVTTATKMITAQDGGLRLAPGSLSATAPDLLTFYDSPFGRDYVVDKDDRGVPTGFRFSFIRDPAGRVRWLYINGGLWRHES